MPPPWPTGKHLQTHFVQFSSVHHVQFSSVRVVVHHTMPYRQFSSAPCRTIPSQTSAAPYQWVCYRRRNQWLRLALASFCLHLTWLARVVYLRCVEGT